MNRAGSQQADDDEQHDFEHRRHALRDAPGVVAVTVDVDHKTEIVEGGEAENLVSRGAEAPGFKAAGAPDVQQSLSIV